MSHRGTLNKKLNRLRKATRVPLPAHFDLVDWLKDRRHAQTTGEANRLILAGRVRNGSHVVGVVNEPEYDTLGKPTGETISTVRRVQPVSKRDDLIVLDPA